MAHDFRIRKTDMSLADELCAAIKKCPFEYSKNCILVDPLHEPPCKDCPALPFKTALIKHARPFWILWQNFLLSGLKPQYRNKAVSHLLIGVGALYSLNKRRIPPVSDSLIDKIKAENRSHGVGGFMSELADDLKGFGGDWYQKFYSVWEEAGADEDIWIGNVVLLKVFLEAMKFDPANRREDPKKSKEPIKDWGSEIEKEELSGAVLDFMKEARRKSQENDKKEGDKKSDKDSKK